MLRSETILGIVSTCLLAIGCGDACERLCHTWGDFWTDCGDTAADALDLGPTLYVDPEAVYTDDPALANNVSTELCEPSDLVDGCLIVWHDRRALLDADGRDTALTACEGSTINAWREHGDCCQALTDAGYGNCPDRP